MEGEVITMQEIFRFERQGVDEDGKVTGQFQATGIRPRFSDRLRAYGVDLGDILFSNREPVEAGGGAEKARGWQP